MANKKNGKIKLNDKLDNKKKVKKIKYVSEEASTMKRFIIILISIIVLILVVYGISFLFKDNDDTTSDEVTAGAIDYDKVSIGTMLNRNVDDYYVMIYDSENSNAIYYSTIINLYMSSEDSKTIYYCDLGNYLNSYYYVGDDGTSNPDATSLEDLALGKLTLIEVKKGKIVKYIEDIDTIKTEFGI